MSSLAELALRRRRGRGTVTQRGWAELWSRIFDDGTAVGRAVDVEAHMVQMIPSTPSITLIAVGAWPMQSLFRWAAFAVVEDVPFVIPPVRGPELTVHLDQVRAYDVPDLDDPPWQDELARSYRRAAGVDTVAPRSAASALPSIDLGPTILAALPDDVTALTVFEWLARMTGVGAATVAEAEVTPGLDVARAATRELPREVASWGGGGAVLGSARFEYELDGQAGGARAEVAALRLVRGPRWRFSRTLVADLEGDGEDQDDARS